ncbi:cation:proton antiporter [Microbacterium azadirachtae]|uniref:Sodium/hydrogen exchanger family protein n=1 Tax=Microbacterium azadirachtae TaxID=582680 RepID=A0A0F0LRY5_9MICO|nr:cation:proton antiporter [Microbacterium azadirachtae]KJL35898.1 Sodium/hydrogen exchanger family protein [Microbacterium azadirachtae]
MTFATLALLVLVGLAGPVLSARRAWRIPVIAGELGAGLAIGSTEFGWVDAAEPTFTLLAQLGFGLIMLVIGSHIPIRDTAVRAAVGRGAAGAAIVAAVAVALGVGTALLFGTSHGAVYSVLIASSSAALVLPMLRSLDVSADSAAQLIAQIAIADVACIVALPLVLQPERVPLVALGGVGIAVVGVVLVLVLRRVGTHRLRVLHELSESRQFALELRFSLLALFGLAGIAQFTHVSVMMAGFTLGLVLSAVGQPRRLARQLFGMTEGFFGPLFFVWLGASINLRDLGSHPEMILLGLALGAAAVVAHLAGRITGLPWAQAVASAGQLGVPVAAVALGVETKALLPGEGAAILLGALVAVVASSAAVAVVSRRNAASSPPASPEERPASP